MGFVSFKATRSELLSGKFLGSAAESRGLPLSNLTERRYSLHSSPDFPERIGVTTGKTCQQKGAVTRMTGLIGTSAKTISGTFSGMARGEC